MLPSRRSQPTPNSHTTKPTTILGMTANKTLNTIPSHTQVFGNCNTNFSNSFHEFEFQHLDSRSWRPSTVLYCSIPDRDITPEDGPSEWEQKKMAELAELNRDDDE